MIVKRLASSLFLLLLSTWLQAEQLPNSVHSLHAIEGKLDGEALRFEYLKFLPADYAQNDRAYPLVLFLHGAGARGSNGRDLLEHHLPIVLEDKAAFPAIVISPQCPSGKWWSGEMIDNLQLLMQEVTANNRVDPDRIYLTGLSMGGWGTWNMLRKYPDWFAAFASLCGGEGEHGMDAFTHIPGRAYHGEMDRMVSVNKTHEVVNAFRKAGGQIDVFLYPEVGHGVWEQAYEPPELWLWLLGQHKSDPDFQYEPSEYEQAFFERWRQGDAYEAATEPMSTLALHKESDTIRIVRENPTPWPLREELVWETENTAYEIEPTRQVVDLPANGRAEIAFQLRFGGEPAELSPAPKLLSTVKHEQAVIKVLREKLSFDDFEYFRSRVAKAKAVQLEQAPSIDGLLEQGEWDGATRLGPLRRRDNRSDYPVKTQHWIAYDEHKLYLAVRVPEPDPAGLRARHKKRDQNIYHDDNISFFLQPELGSKDYYHIIVNAQGAVMDAIEHDRGWNGQYEVQAQVGEDAWQVEFAITWSELGMQAPRAGQSMGLQLGVDRKRTDGKGGQWSPAYGWAHQANRFGVLSFE